MSYSFCRPALLLVLGLLVTSCASSAQLAQRNEERCANRGFEPKSDAFSNCIVQLENERDARMESRRREMLEKPYVPPTN